jgi:hypothetical protein
VLQLVGDLVAHPPLLVIVLDHQEHVDQILARVGSEDLHEVRQMRNC